MKLREYREEDCRELARLFYDTVHTVNGADYTGKQLDAWAPEDIDLASWNQSFLEHHTVVAVRDGIIAVSETWRMEDIWTDCTFTGSTKVKCRLRHLR